MTGIIISAYQPEDEAVVEDITHQTGFEGEDSAGRDFSMTDKEEKLSCLIYFLCYYGLSVLAKDCKLNNVLKWRQIIGVFHN